LNDAEYWKQRHRVRTEPDYQGADLTRAQYRPQVERPPILFKLLDGKPVINGSARLSSDYGYRLDPFTSREAFHSGVDIAAAFGTPVHAPTAGTVTFAGIREDHGRTVDVATPDGSTLRFSHLNDISVVVGAKVASGSQVGTVGNDGQSTGAHLHFEVIRDGKAINPASVGDLVMIGG
jgi:murein DD-endopeptidase MepM/ murein hydrolase activator NlpD